MVVITPDGLSVVRCAGRVAYLPENHAVRKVRT
jgi:hypothetical protein